MMNTDNNKKLYIARIDEKESDNWMDDWCDDSDDEYDCEKEELYEESYLTPDTILCIATSEQRAIDILTDFVYNKRQEPGFENILDDLCFTIEEINAIPYVKDGQTIYHSYDDDDEDYDDRYFVHYVKNGQSYYYIPDAYDDDAHYNNENFAQNVVNEKIKQALENYKQRPLNQGTPQYVYAVAFWEDGMDACANVLGYILENDFSIDIIAKSLTDTYYDTAPVLDKNNESDAYVEIDKYNLDEITLPTEDTGTEYVYIHSKDE